MKPGPLLALLLLVAPSQSLFAEETEPWWVTERYQPAQNKIQSIPVKQLDKTWVKASPLTKEKLSEDAVLRLGGEPSYQFEVEADFNKDGRRDRAMVGVYEDASGAKGRFLLILTEEGRGAWKKAFLEKVPGDPGFSVLVYEEGGSLGWVDCFECDAELGDLMWDGTKYSLVVPETDSDIE